MPCWGPAPREPRDHSFVKSFALINSLNCRVVAIDIPSGLDCDQGVVDAEYTIRATVNCTFVSLKPCHQIERARDFCGQIVVLDIGVPSEVVERVLSGS